MRSLGLRSNLSATAVHGIEKLGRDPGTETLAAICKTLNVSMAYIMFGLDVTPETEEILLLLQEKPAKHQAMISLLRE